MDEYIMLYIGCNPFQEPPFTLVITSTLLQMESVESPLRR
jgi:hypothetical protein